MSRMKTQTNRALKYLKDTEYFDKAKEIVESINKRLDEIALKQSDETISREEHIGMYRTHLKVMDNVKDDIRSLEKLLQHSGGPPSVEFLKDTVFEEKQTLDKITAWKVIIAIIGFLGLLGIGFYVRWFLMVRNSRAATSTQNQDTPPFKVEEVVNEKPGDNSNPESH